MQAGELSDSVRSEAGLAWQGGTLRTTDTSPFGRKVRIALAMIGRLEQVAVVPGSPIDPTDPLLRDNPLGKMPCFVVPDGSALYDSPVILDYLDEISDGMLIPADRQARLVALKEQALADGLSDAAVLTGSERMFHPADQVSERWIAHQMAKVQRALAAFAVAPPTLEPVTIGAISLACALGYLDWRKVLDWREAYPDLGVWLAEFIARVPAYDQTRSGY